MQATIDQDVKRYGFYEIFRQNPDGSLTPKRPIFINGISFGPGVSFTRGVLFGGVNIFNFLGKDIAGLEDSGMLKIQGYYN